MASIQTNVAANNALRNLTTTGIGLDRQIAKLSSGFRINRSGDDAAGMAIANKLRAEARSLQQAQRNAAQANAMLQIADGAIGTVSSILDRMKELASQANSDNVGVAPNSQHTKLDAEFQQLLEEIDRIANTTKYQGTALVDGTTPTLSFMVSSSGAYAGDDLVEVDGIDLTTTGLGFTFGTDDILDSTNARLVLDKIDAAIDLANEAIGTVGAAQSRIEFASANVATITQNVLAAESTIRDADMAAETTAFTKFQILQQAGIAMLAQANSSAQSVLSLLR